MKKKGIEFYRERLKDEWIKKKIALMKEISFSDA